ncbi:OVARIAN TUMOR DOMAIN-containing deubiquitinating enzyme 4-like isoform X2 [Aristolochia californica]|uniref:OVARIAN TUMOR DOMAIN-containing deubiquitinating enzyme 4-like isoform X2 n=1 Tax=Aristolochia californica TaxID=171875 RepID=UPI0035DD24F1
MVVSFSFTTCGRGIAYRCDINRKQMLSNIYARTRLPSKSCSSLFHCEQFRQRYASVTFCRSFSCSSFLAQVSVLSSFCSDSSMKGRSRNPLIMNSLSSSGHQHISHLSLLSRCRNLTLRLSLPKHGSIAKMSWKVGSKNWVKGGSSAGMVFGVCLGISSFQPVYAKAVETNNEKNSSPPASPSCGKKVYTDYSITGIPGDGRCLFRSVAHGACLRTGKPAPDEILQRQLADELRARVADEFVKRREETEWFVEGDFDTYVEQIRKPHVWGGEPELFMASHVLQMPITVFMHDESSGGLIIIAEYGQEYEKDNPITVLYHGFGHYEALQIPGKKGRKSRL